MSAFIPTAARPARFNPRPARRRKKSSPAKRPVKQTVIRLDPLATLAMIVAVTMVAMMLVGWSKLKQAKQEQAQMADYVQQLEIKNEELQKTYENGYDLDTVRQAATALGLVPIAEAEHISIQAMPQQEVPVQEPTLWEKIVSFLAGLSA